MAKIPKSIEVAVELDDDSWVVTVRVKLTDGREEGWRLPSQFGDRASAEARAREFADKVKVTFPDAVERQP